MFEILSIVLLAGPFNMQNGPFPLRRSQSGNRNRAMLPPEVMANAMTLVCFSPLTVS